MRCWMGERALSGRVGSSRIMERYRERRWDGEAMSTIVCAGGMGKEMQMMTPKKDVNIRT